MVSFDEKVYKYFIDYKNDVYEIKPFCIILPKMSTHVENEVGRLVPDLSLFFNKILFTVKTSSQHLSFNTFW